jgi:hypothetical protein
VFLAAWMRRDWQTLLKLVVHHCDITALSSTPHHPSAPSETSLTTSATKSTGTTHEEKRNSENPVTTKSTSHLNEKIKTSLPLISDICVVNRFIEGLLRLLLLRLFTIQLDTFFLRTFRILSFFFLSLSLSLCVCMLGFLPPDQFVYLHP